MTQQIDRTKELQPQLLAHDGPVCLIIKARLTPVGGLDRFQPAGFPEIGHVIFDAPRADARTEKVCIVDSPASMANHLEHVCCADSLDLHPDLSGLPYVRCTTDRNPQVVNGAVVLKPDDPRDRVVATTLTEGHRLASEYFLDGLLDPQWVDEKTTNTKKKDGTENKKIEPAHWEGTVFRSTLRNEFKITEVKADKKYFIPPESWWSIFQTIFKYDPNSLVHGVLFAREQIKISRLLTAHLEAFGAARVGRSGVKFDRLGKTTSGQPIFAVDEETASEIRATFIFDIALLRSYGRNDKGLSDVQKRLLFDLALWKVARLLERPFRYRSGCHLQSNSVTLSTESQDDFTSSLPTVNMPNSISTAQFSGNGMTEVYYPANELFKPTKEEESTGAAGEDEPVEEEETEE